MIEFIDICELYRTIQKKRICVFGAGKAGSTIFSYLRMHGCRYLFVADNDMNKHGPIDNEYEIGSFEKSAQMNTDLYLVGFLNNDIEKIKSVIDFLYYKGISKEKIKCINFKSDWVENFSIDYTEQKLKKLKLNYKKEEKKITRIVIVSTLYNEDDKKRISGGPIGAANMQRILLDDQYKEMRMECMLFPKKWEVTFAELFNKYQYILFAARFLACDAQKNDAIYISNDIYSAYALAKYEQKYILLYHGQGDLVSDMNAFGANLTGREREMFTWIEKEGIENAFKTYFPSSGARKHFLNTVNQKIKVGFTEPLYNCIYDYPKEDFVSIKNDECLSFFSIGQMTKLKGMDRIPLFLERIRRCTGKKIKWTVVADGELKREVANEIRVINEQNGGKENIDYKIIDEYLSHKKIYALMAQCDIYIMLHRISIFDFSTIEAMYMGKAVILSDIVGNDEFNIDNNILMVNEDLQDSDIVSFIQNLDSYGKKNRKVYDENFSIDMFRKRYYRAINELMA